MLLYIALFALSCAGVGDAGEESAPEGPAEVSLSVSPEKFDSGDRTIVKAVLKKFKRDAVIAKFRFPTALKYVGESSALIIGGVMFDVNPTDRITVDSVVYMIYFLDRAELGSKDIGRIEVVFELEGRSSITDGIVAVDIDVDDEGTRNSREFDPTDPKFDAQSQVTIQVGTETETTDSTT